MSYISPELVAGGLGNVERFKRKFTVLKVAYEFKYRHRIFYLCYFHVCLYLILRIYQANV